MKTAGRETQNRWGTVTGNRVYGAAGQNRSHLISWAAKQEKIQPGADVFFLDWKKTPMANVVRDPREHPEAIIPDPATNTVAKFSKDQIAFVYGSVWKQRYFTKVGDDYFPLPAQWDVIHKKWLPYFVKPGTDWWAPFYPADNLQRPTGPTCDGCHSVGFDMTSKQVAEWNVGWERCHGPGSERFGQRLYELFSALA
jgi:hypothetical protein